MGRRSGAAAAVTPSGRRTPRRVPSPLLVVLAAVCWGTGGLAGSVLSRSADLSPIAVGAYRLVVAALALLALTAARRQGAALLTAVRDALAHRADAARLVLVGVGLAVFQACYFLAVDRLGVSVATMLTLGSAPVLVTVGAATVLRERVGPRLLLALPVAVAGLALLVDVSSAASGVGPVGSSGTSGGDGAVVVGVGYALVSATGYAAVTLTGRALAPRVGSEHVTTAGFLVAAAVALPVGAVVGLGFAPTAGSLALVLYLGVVPTALAYAAFFAGLRGTPSGVASVLTLVEPLTATVLAMLLLGERLTLLQAGGALLLCAVVVLLATAGPRPAGSSDRGGPSAGAAARSTS